MLSKVIAFKYVDVKAANTALSASARLIVHKGVHNFRYSQFSVNDDRPLFMATYSRPLIHRDGLD